jgi:hypothetical protein
MHVGWRRKGEWLGIKYLGLGYEGEEVFGLGRRGKLWRIGIDTRPSKGRMVFSIVSFCPSTSSIGFTTSFPVLLIFISESLPYPFNA